MAIIGQGLLLDRGYYWTGVILGQGLLLDRGYYWTGAIIEYGLSWLLWNIEAGGIIRQAILFLKALHDNTLINLQNVDYI